MIPRWYRGTETETAYSMCFCGNIPCLLFRVTWSTLHVHMRCTQTVEFTTESCELELKLTNSRNRLSNVERRSCSRERNRDTPCWTSQQPNRSRMDGQIDRKYNTRQDYTAYLSRTLPFSACCILHFRLDGCDSIQVPEVIKRYSVMLDASRDGLVASS